MILGDGIDDLKKSKRRGKYRGTTQGRLTRIMDNPSLIKTPSPVKESPQKSSSTPVKPKSQIENRSSKKFEEDKYYENGTDQKATKKTDHEESKNSELNESFNARGSFASVNMSMQKVTIDKCSLYAEGPITKYIDTIWKLPYETISNFGSITVSKIAWGYHHLFVQLDNGMVFASGNNSQGQLNLNIKKYPEINGLIPHDPINHSYEVTDIGCGSNHTVLLAILKGSKTNNRQLLTCGYHGCLGVLDVNEDTHILQNVKIPELKDFDKIDYLICRFNSSAVLDDDNNLFYWGDDFDGFRERVPKKVDLFDHNIVDISFGFRHAVALLENGDVYTWGDGTYGEINYQFITSNNGEPIKISYFDENNIEIIKVEAGWRHSIFLDKKGNVYGCGLTKTINNKTERVYYPDKIEDISDSNCIDVFSGETVNVAIDQTGVPYKWEGVNGKYEIISDVSGRYINDVVVSNRNIIILA